MKCNDCKSECDGIGFDGMIDGTCYRCALAQYGELKTEVGRLRIENASLQAVFNLEKTPHSQLCLELEILKNELVAMKAADAAGGDE